MAASVDGKTCSSPAEMLFRSRVLRTFLYNQGVEPVAGSLSGQSIFKARPPRAATPQHPTPQHATPAATATTCRAATAAPGGMFGSFSTPVLAQPTLLPFHSAEARVSSAAEKARSCREWGRVGVAPRRVPPPPQRTVPGSSAHGRSPPGTGSSSSCFAGDDDLCPAASSLLRRPSRSSMPRRTEMSKGARRRRPLYDFFSEDDPLFVPFSEEPDDPRVLLPAHRIGDTPPEVSESQSPKTKVSPRPAKASPGSAKRKAGKPMKGSNSMPSLRVSAKKLPLYAAPAPAPASTHGAFAGSSPASDARDAPLSSAGSLRGDAGSARWAENSPSRPVRRKPTSRRDIVWRGEDEDDDDDGDVEQVDVSSLPDSLAEDMMPE